LLHFLSRGTMTIATTHYSDLKAFAHVTPGLQNASFDFDPLTLIPTYHLTVGIPGGSNALTTASRLGLPAKIVNDARGMLSKGTQELEALLTDLVEEKREIKSLRYDLERDRDEIKQQKAELETELRLLKAGEQKVIQEARDRVLREAAELHKEIRVASSELRKEKSRERIEQSRRALAAVHGQLQGEVLQAKTAEGTDGEAADLGSIVVGDTVRIKDLNLQAKVLSVSEEAQQLEVQAGQTKIRLSLGSVEKLIMPPGSETPKFIPVRRQLPSRTVSPDLDLRGKRADEIDWALDSYLNNASLTNLNEVRIVHGFGTGTVRKIVRDLLASHPLAKSFRPGEKGEGNDGVTIVKL